jgi:site-specific DNA recombinase
MKSPWARAVLYARVSSKDQEREGFSIPAQQKLLRQHAREHRLTIVQEFVDVETAKQAGRAGFGEMLAFLRSDAACRTILVEKTDRLYRNIRDWITVDDLDLAVHFVKENAIVSKASRSSEKFMHGIKVLMAKNYVDNLSEEVKKGLREKAEQGHWPPVAPVGYVNNLATHRIEPDPVRAPLIATLFELYATGQMSLQELTTRAQARGLTHPRSGRRMMKAEIHRILQNQIYTGDFKWLGRSYHGSHEPLIFTRAVRRGAGCVESEAPSPVPETEARLHGSADVRPLRLLDDRRAQEGEVHILPMHRLPRPLRQRVHPRGAARRPPRRRRQAHSDADRARRLDC